jgi:hypothetical protein
VVAEVRYVGNHTVGNFLNFDANPALNGFLNVASPSSACDSSQAPNCYAGSNFANLIPAGLTPCTDPTQPDFAGLWDCTHSRVQERDKRRVLDLSQSADRIENANFHGLTATAVHLQPHDR